MFNYGFDNFTKTEVDGGSVLLPKGTDLNSLTKKSEDVNGKTETSYYFGEYLVGRCVSETGISASYGEEHWNRKLSGKSLPGHLLSGALFYVWDFCGRMDIPDAGNAGILWADTAFHWNYRNLSYEYPQ